MGAGLTLASSAFAMPSSGKRSSTCTHASALCQLSAMPDYEEEPSTHCTIRCIAKLAGEGPGRGGVWVKTKGPV